MIAWSVGHRAAEALRDGTVRSLINSYRTDPDSPIHGKRFQSRETYLVHLSGIEKSVGARPLSGLGGRDFLRWFDEWKQRPHEAEPHAARAHARISMVRIIMNFGVVMEVEHCDRLALILSKMEFQNIRPRGEALNAQQATAIRRRAHEIGRPSIALAQAFQFELMLRPKDVIGEWLPIDEPGLSQVNDGLRKWLFGLDWREVSPDLILTHRLSKSLKGRGAVLDPKAGKTKRFDLKLYPMVMEELALIPPERRTGPIVVDDRHGLPWRNDHYRRAWRAIATAVGVPETVQNRDSRAGGISEGAAAMDGDLEALRKAAGHSKLDTTALYSREQDAATDKVAVFRARKREEKT